MYPRCVPHTFPTSAASLPGAGDSARLPTARPLPAVKFDARPEATSHGAPPLSHRLAIALLILLGAWLNLLSPLDLRLHDVRYRWLHRPPGGQIVAVTLDARNFPFVGPWPRARIATLLDRLRELGVRQTVFDIDFSAETDAENDGLFAAALKRASGEVALAGFARNNELGGETLAKPLPLFRNFAAVAQADAPGDADGRVRDYRTELMLGGRTPSIAAALAHMPLSRPRSFGIDYGIDVDAVERISAADVIAGVVDRQRLAGKDVLVSDGAGADGRSAKDAGEPRLTPRFGTLPDALVHVAAAETLLAHRAMRDAPRIAIWLLTMLLAIGPSLMRRKPPVAAFTGATAAAALALEFGALALQQAFAIRLDTGAPLTFLSVVSLVGLLAHKRRRRRRLLQAARERELLQAVLARVVADPFDGVVVIEPDGMIVAASVAARTLLGADIEGRPAFDALPPEFAGPLARAIARAAASSDRSRTPESIELRSGDGPPRHIEFVIALSPVEGSESRLVASLTFRDVTERRTREAQRAQASRADELTGAWSGGQLSEGLRERFAGETGKPRPLALFSLNLRRFSAVNSVYGRQTGDRLLRMVADRLSSGGLTMVTRLGGDHFAFALAVAGEENELATIGASVIARICAPYWLGDTSIVIGVSLGATTTRLSGVNPDDLLSHAHLAQTAARQRGGDAFALFSPAMESTQREKQRIDTALRGAIGDGSLELNYQPKIELRTGRMVGAEALMRWRTADGAAVSPSQFIPIAEESGLIVELGRWALRQACLECVRWEGEASVAVNVSPVQFALADVFADVWLALEASGLPPHRLEIEITEGCFVHRDSDVAQTLERLRALGVTIAIDDFGTGYSSLQYLGRLPFDTIKIDQSFIRELATDARAAETVRAISSLARTHGKLIVAEGVETEAQANWLAGIGCEFVQGYFYARSRDAATLRMDLARQAA